MHKWLKYSWTIGINKCCCFISEAGTTRYHETGFGNSQTNIACKQPRRIRVWPKNKWFMLTTNFVNSNISHLHPKVAGCGCEVRLSFSIMTLKICCWQLKRLVDYALRVKLRRRTVRLAPAICPTEIALSENFSRQHHSSWVHFV